MVAEPSRVRGSGARARLWITHKESWRKRGEGCQVAALNTLGPHVSPAVGPNKVAPSERARRAAATRAGARAISASKVEGPAEQRRDRRAPGAPARVLARRPAARARAPHSRQTLHNGRCLSNTACGRHPKRAVALVAGRARAAQQIPRHANRRKRVAAAALSASPAMSK